mmetsp:Transcript_15799/g.36580  ORF Transcript_15799/g.36580 Transcript_15799/m.36580 type:complete len:90 (+) Transcript_15799:148-417(+)
MSYDDRGSYRAYNSGRKNKTSTSNSKKCAHPATPLKGSEPAIGATNSGGFMSLFTEAGRISTNPVAPVIVPVPPVIVNCPGTDAFTMMP